ncbi:MAG: heavy metal-associated domain-containing protein [Eubacteriales bacterium]|nr:heavy metal-associated domain-containing protein [Eubacteriales bacterium]
MINEQYNVEGMHCASCQAAVEVVTQGLPGVEKSEVNLLTKNMSITYDESQLNEQDILAAISRLGFTASKKQEETSKKKAPMK